MFVARNHKGLLCNALEGKIEKGADCVCPACSGAVRFKKGKVMQPHFAHVSLGECRFYRENESAEHLNLKADLFRWAVQKEEVEVEAFLPALQQIADLLVDTRLALEVQCSPLSIERLQERTLSYRQHGYQVLWLLGRKLWLKDSLTRLQKDFLYFSKIWAFISGSWIKKSEFCV